MDDYALGYGLEICQDICQYWSDRDNNITLLVSFIGVGNV